MSIMSIYVAHPISGLTADEVFEYYEWIKKRIFSCSVLSPMVGKEHLRTEKKFKTHSYHHPVSTNHAIVERDSWMVRKSDIVLIDLLSAKDVSIGCVSELAWGFMLGKHTIVVMDKENVHQHAFVLEMADIIFETIEDALVYINKL